ncbi:hypothetical protein [Thiomicrorhabdus sediminis]|uniref:Uncharacterized protein n=1 Tax=Thiomicrorhabdus sediminis TaxID=2580412 RepID=A0A4P9K6S7_9GAMM|nr:hypothetical protein [Thiomicrorhabdus sediminis]QCU90160.1 hypothetical protein FE785_05720 [Thiomicrorhabdus sediminis]
MQQRDVLTLWMPDLLHPQRIAEAEEELKKLRLPALQTLLARADKFPVKPQDFYEQASYLFHQAESLPIAVCRALGDDVISRLDSAEASQYWLCVDPVQMIPDRDSLVLIPNSELAVTRQESSALVTSFNEHFAEDGIRLLLGDDTHWYLAMPQAIRLQTTVIDHVAFKPINEFYPQGSAAQYWRQLINETQMLFFNHPVNEQRRLQGMAEINSIWVWGQGQLDTTQVKLRSNAAVYAQQSFFKGMAKICQSEFNAVPLNFQNWHKSSQANEHFFVFDQMSSQLDGLQLLEWVALLQQLEKDWFAPLLQALKSGQIKEVLLDIGAQYRYHCQSTHLKRFWRMKKSLHKMH